MYKYVMLVSIKKDYLVLFKRMHTFSVSGTFLGLALCPKCTWCVCNHPVKDSLPALFISFLYNRSKGFLHVEFDVIGESEITVSSQLSYRLCY